jgi:hypothetical protein
MDLWINIAKPELLVLLRNVDGWRSTTTRPSCSRGRRTRSPPRGILEMGPRFVVVKKGEHGCILVHRAMGSQRCRRTPPRPS